MKGGVENVYPSSTDTGRLVGACFSDSPLQLTMAASSLSVALY